MAVMLESADDCNAVIIWAGDKGVRWPITGYLQCLTSLLHQDLCFGIVNLDKARIFTPSKRCIKVSTKHL